MAATRKEQGRPSKRAAAADEAAQPPVAEGAATATPGVQGHRRGGPGVFSAAARSFWHFRLQKGGAACAAVVRAGLRALGGPRTIGQGGERRRPGGDPPRLGRAPAPSLEIEGEARPAPVRRPLLRGPRARGPRAARALRRAPRAQTCGELGPAAARGLRTLGGDGTSTPTEAAGVARSARSAGVGYHAPGQPRGLDHRRHLRAAMREGNLCPAGWSK